MKNNSKALGFFLTFVLILILPTSYLSESYYLWALICFTSFLISRKDTNTYSKKIKISSLIVSIIFLICLSFKSILKSQLYSSVLSGISLYIIGYIIIPILIVYSFYISFRYLLINIPNIEKYLNKKISNVRIIKTLNGIIILLCGITIFRSICNATYSDPMIVYFSFSDGIWSHWHTIGYSIYLFLTYKITGTFISVYVANSLLYFFTYKYVFNIIKQQYKEKSVVIFQMMTILFFQPFVYLHVPAKDTIFAICILGFISYLYRLIYKELETKDIVLGILFTSGVLLFRHASIAPIIVTFISFLIYMIVNNKQVVKNLIIPFSASLLVFLIVTYGVAGLLKAKENPKYIKYTTPVYMVSSFLAEDENYISKEDKKILEQMMFIDEYIFAYDKYWADTVFRSGGIPGSRISRFDEYKMGLPVLKMNLKLFLKHPIKYINKLSNIDSILFEITTPNDGYDWAPIIGHAPETGILDTYNYQSGINSILKEIEYLSGKIVIIKDIYWRGGFYQLAFIILIVINIIKNTKKNILLIIPLMVIQLLLYISVPSQDPRYILPLIITLPFITLITLNDKRRRA